MRTSEQILKSAKTVAVVGMSNKQERASYEVAEYLQSHGYEILPVNPAYAGQQILGRTVYATLQEAADVVAKDGRRIDVVDCFRKSEDSPPIAQDAIDVR